MRQRRAASLRLLLGGILGGLALALCSAAPASAQTLGPYFGIDTQEPNSGPHRRLLPEGFFDNFPTSKIGDIAVEADTLTFDADTNMVIATGNVQMSYQGWLGNADRAEYDRTTGDLVLIGHAIVRDPDEVVYTGDRISVTGDMKLAFANALRLQTPNGALITGTTAEYRDQTVAMFEDGTYAPCGLCQDENGNTIGWSVHAARAVLNREEKTLYVEEPTIVLLGHPIATIPFYWLPDPTDPRSPGFRLPRTGYTKKQGFSLSVPFFTPFGPDSDLWLTPKVMSRQGGLLSGDFTHRFGMGSVSVLAAGIYQFDPAAYGAQVGNRSWRGAIQGSGRFTPIENWSAGWSYQKFSDPNFTHDYKLEGYRSINNAYVQHLSEDIFFDARLQEFLRQGPYVTPAQQSQEGATLPLATYEQMLFLPQEMGNVRISGDLIGVSRGLDDVHTVGLLTDIDGYMGNKVHGSAEALWSKQWIVPGGLVVTPSAGLKLDGAYYDGASTLSPVATTLFSATPIAALDVRFPMIAIDGDNTNLFEPIAQIYYRGSSTSMPGINNDNAQGFQFEDTNLFSFNRFSGSDRQETGLRANLGGQYMANFEDGSWLRLIGGQSYQLAGFNAFSITDHTLLGPGTGLGGVTSNLVAGANAYLGGGVEVAGKIEVDPTTPMVTRGGIGTQLRFDAFTLDTNYYYEAANPAAGVTKPTHVVSAKVAVPLYDDRPVVVRGAWNIAGATVDGSVSVPFADYWSAKVGGSWDLAASDWTSLRTEVKYDDNYLIYGGYYRIGHNIVTNNLSHRFGVILNLKGP
ncbi:MAG: LPS-assembly protein LptD [Hyphomicrobiaceae bacterium]|nr:LPS-assembly protein LptD [Hyphomicrobiaceae bacterium]